jgi:hypothetical protein
MQLFGSRGYQDALKCGSALGFTHRKYELLIASMSLTLICTWTHCTYSKSSLIEV